MVLPYALIFCRILIGGVFLVSFSRKALSISTFALTIERFGILPQRMSQLAAILFLLGELAVVILTSLGGVLTLLGFILSVGLLLIFCAGLTVALARGVEAACNCFGATEGAISVYDVVRNVGFMAIAGGGVVILGTSTASQHRVATVEWLLVGLAAAIFAAIWINLHEIVNLFVQF